MTPEELDAMSKLYDENPDVDALILEVRRLQEDNKILKRCLEVQKGRVLEERERAAKIVEECTLDDSGLNEGDPKAFALGRLGDTIASKIREGK